jgi:hypothetical protein
MVPCLRRDGVWIPAFAGMTAFAVINVAVYKRGKIRNPKAQYQTQLRI